MPSQPQPRRSLTAAGLVVALALALGGFAAKPPVATSAATGLPSDRLHFGVSSAPGHAGWMTSSGAPWRYRYQYLSGGIDTGAGWETWQDPALPAGQFALDYMNDSRTNGYIPVLTYYELLQSHRASDEATDDYSNLNNPTLMRDYYANFRLLMQRAAQHGGQVVVHVEPDLWGYLQQRSGNTSPAGVSASVGGSGFSDVAAYPNTAQGFGQALVHLRDTYAPNVLVAAHASMWASGRDLATDTDAGLGAAAEADRTAAFLAAAAAWDLVFNDVDDHDAGWWEANGSTAHWWDPTNRRVPNFTRYLQWVGELHARMGRPQVAWQVPVGNQRYLTMTNTCGHYQDNVAEYFLAHTQDLFTAGLVAVLFGAGNGCQTTNEDGQADGVTNAAAPTADAFTRAQGWCDGCNGMRSTVADDDGGFLRSAVTAYYAVTPAAPGAYHPLNPARVLDTRTTLGGHPGRLGAGESFVLQVPGVPAGATAAVLNVGVTNAGGAPSTYVLVSPADQPLPVASTVNVVAGQTVANLAQVRLSAGGEVTVFNAAGSVDAFIDLEGYYAAAAAAPGSGLYNALPAPVRLLDTRGGHALGPGGRVRVQVAGWTDPVTHAVPVPATATAVILNLTEVGGTSPSYLAAWPDGLPQPAVSNLNFPAGRVLANRAIVTTGASYVDIYNSAGTADVLVDIAGWFSSGQPGDSGGGRFTPATPARVFDTRTGLGGHRGPLGPGESTSVPLAGGGAVADLNVTALDAGTYTFVGLYPAVTANPQSSDLNLGPGDILANNAVVRIAGGAFVVYNSAGTTDVFADLAGTYA